MSISAAGILSMQPQTGTKSASNASTSLAAPSAKNEFLDYMKLTPAQKMEKAILAEMGITKQDLENMPPEQRKAIEETIREKIKEKMKAEGNSDKGMIADLKV